MAILNKGQTFSDGEQVTSAKLNTVVDGATFASGAVDDVSTQLSGGAIIVKDGGVGTAKIADNAVTSAKVLDSNITKGKIENVANMKVLGNISGSSAAPQEVSILDEDNMTSDSNTSIPTQQSVKTYVDTKRPEFVNFTGGTHSLTKTSNGTYTYNIVDFTGTGLNTSKITSIHLSVDINSIYGTESVLAKFPDGTEYVICSISSIASNLQVSHNAMPVIPVNSGQTTFEIRMVQGIGGSRNVKLIGATQIL